MYPQALDIFSKLPDNIREKTAVLSYAYALSGDKKKAEAELNKTLAEHSDLDPSSFALIYTGLERYDEALTQWERGYDKRIIFMVTLKIGIDCDPLRNEPRFKALLKKMNFE
jgi:hypothetical protein